MAKKQVKKKESAIDRLINAFFGSKDVPNSAQTTIPYKRLYRDENTKGGIIETSDGVFSKSYMIPDTNYSDAGDENQEHILKQFETILSTFSPNAHYQITVNNRTIDQNEFNKRVLIDYKNDSQMLDKLRAQHNELVIDKMQEGKNNLVAEKYLTVSVNCENIREAMREFASIEKDLDFKFKQINQLGMKAISLRDRLEILHDIYNNGQEGTFSSKFSLEDVVSQGISSKDIIGPTSFDFTKPGYFKMDDKFCRVMFLKAIPTRLSSVLMESLSQVSANTVISVHYEMQPQDKAAAFASAQVTNVGGEVVNAQKALTKAGASPDLISPSLATAQQDAKELLAELTDGNQNMFHVTLVAAIYADTLDDLDLYTQQMITKAKEKLCTLTVLNMQQEQGFNTVVPLGLNQVKVHKVLTTYSTATIQPFSTQELQIKGGFYYGLNQQSKNLIIYNRSVSANQNGVILGSPGKGKSFAAKMEMYQAYLNTDKSQLFIIDPEREYIGLAQALGGSIVSIAAGSETYINPLDLDITKNKDDPGDPFAEKVDFVIAIVETMLGGHAELSGYLKGIIDNTLQNLYADYLQYLKAKDLSIDTSMCPTLKDFHEALRARKEPEARNLADAIQMYCVGTLNLFAHHTNIDTSNRMIVYDTKNMTENLQKVGMQICLNDIWNRMISNKKRSVRTYFYVDEFYLMLRQPSSAKFLQMIWKRARKWMGTPTGITQNVSDLVNSEEGVTILQTSDFALMLGQSYADRVALAKIYNLSEEQQQYIDLSAASGTGLIFTSRSIVPFENIISENSPIYKLLSTKAEDAESLGSDNSF